MDHRGPLNENYSNRKGGNEYNPTPVNNRNRNGSISNMSTSKSSKNYPHTRAILIQEAKYQFVPSNEGRREERRLTQGQRNQAQVVMSNRHSNSKQNKDQTSSAPTQNNTTTNHNSKSKHKPQTGNISQLRKTSR